jgi:hypothetical protein
VVANEEGAVTVEEDTSADDEQGDAQMTQMRRNWEMKWKKVYHPGTPLAG